MAGPKGQAHDGRGGGGVTNWRVPLMRKTFMRDAETREALAEFVRTTERLSMGPMVEAFEVEFGKWQGRKHAVMFNSGSSANLALVRALVNMGRIEWGSCCCDSRMAVSSLTWATNLMPLHQHGIMPVAVDVDPATLNISSELILARLHNRIVPSVLFLTNALGWCGNLPEIKALCESLKILLLEDNCESLGAVVGGVKAGNFGLASTFSFFVGHHLSTIEGGMVCTDDDDLADMLRMVRSHGWARNVHPDRRAALAKSYKVEPFAEPFTFYESGYNLRPTEIQGFLGLTQLPMLDEASAARWALYKRLRGYGVILAADPGSRPCPMALPVICGPGERHAMLRRFTDAGVETRPLIAGNIQRQPFWRDAGWPTYPTPGADYLHENAFYCPLRPDLTEEEISIMEGCLR